MEEIDPRRFRNAVSRLTARHRRKRLVGYVHVQRESYEEAIKQFEIVLDQGFHTAQAHAAMGYCWEQLKRYDKAVESLKLAIEADPDNANARNTLSYTYRRSV